MASRSIDALAVPVRSAAVAMLQACQRINLDVLIYCTLRTNTEQAALFAVGRTLPGRRLTNAGPGQSLHNPDLDGWAWAFDAVPVFAGVALWGDVPAIERMGLAGEAVGLEWAGRWRGSLRETLHFQMKGGRYA